MMLVSTSPAMAITGALSLRASIKPLKRWAVPAPAVPHTATGCPVIYPSATAAKPPYSSCLTCNKVDVSVAVKRVDCRACQRSQLARNSTFVFDRCLGSLLGHLIIEAGRVRR